MKQMSAAAIKSGITDLLIRQVKKLRKSATVLILAGQNEAVTAALPPVRSAKAVLANRSSILRAELVNSALDSFRNNPRT